MGREFLFFRVLTPVGHGGLWSSDTENLPELFNPLGQDLAQLWFHRVHIQTFNLTGRIGWHIFAGSTPV
jgi:hypothetical protein